MPATCDGGDNDACDKHNEDDGRDIFHDAPCAGNIGLIVRTPRETKYSRYYAAEPSLSDTVIFVMILFTNDRGDARLSFFRDALRAARSKGTCCLE
jgi:hypothetical protein